MQPTITFSTFDDATHGASEERDAITTSADLGERGDHYVVQMDLPGYTADDVSISVVDARLEVRAGPRKTSVPDAARFTHRERSQRPVVRTLELPVEVDERETSARVEDGVLTVALAKDYERAAETVDGA